MLCSHAPNLSLFQCLTLTVSHSVIFFLHLFLSLLSPFSFFCYHHLWSTAELTCLQGKQPPPPHPPFSWSFCLSLFYSFITPSLSCALPWHWRDQFTQQQLRQASFVPGLPSEKAFFASGELLTAHSDIERLIALLPNLAVLLFSGSLSC